MIRIAKPNTPPAILLNRGRSTTQRDCDLFDASPQEYLDGKPFTFDSKLYGAKSVKNALRKAQHDKCCFCESKVAHIAYGDVEHFRPKAGYRQNPNDPLGRPGYYWLAYEWNNLFFCCQLCNQRYKRNHFPLADSTQRAISHHDAIGSEQPLFIDPAVGDPSLHIAYREEYAYAVGGSPNGSTTIEALGLNREELAEVRRDYLRPITLLKRLRQRLEELIESGQASEADMALRDEIDAHIEHLIQDRSAYAAMARAALIA